APRARDRERDPSLLGIPAPRCYPFPRMARDFFHRDIELFIDQRFDWERYLRLRGAEATVADEIETYKTILRTTGEICADIEAGAVEHWHEEGRLEDRRGVIPRHPHPGHHQPSRATSPRATRSSAVRGSSVSPSTRSTAATACRCSSTAPTSRWSRAPTRAS